MRIVINGPNQKFPAKVMRPYIRWVAKRLLGEAARDIRIFVENVPEIDRTDGFVFGQATAIHRDSEKRPSMFVIDICNRVSRYRQERTLIHELVHVEQFRNGRLQTGWAKWGKRIVSPNVDYDNLPWEKEANRIERRLTKEWREYKNERG